MLLILKGIMFCVFLLICSPILINDIPAIREKANAEANSAATDAVCSVVEPLLQVHSGARVDRMTLLGSDISLYAGAQPITEQQLGAMHHTWHDTLKVTRQLYLLIY